MRRAALIAIGLTLAITAFHRVALADFRAVEANYVASRQLTACATRELRDFAEGRRDLAALEPALAGIVLGAAGKSAEVQIRHQADNDVVPFPRLPAAYDAAGGAIDAQVDLYRAMLTDPANSEDELDRLTEQRGRAERALDRARSMLLVSEGDGWSTRERCPSA